MSPEVDFNTDEIESSVRVNVPDLRGLLNRNRRDTSAEINCIKIGTIQSFNASNQTAQISINFLAHFDDRSIEYPLLINCPVVILCGASGVLTFPIAAGDTCLVLFCDRDIDNWFETGLSNLPPHSTRVHDLSDGFALVGIRSLLNSLTGYNQNGIQLIHGTKAKLVLESANKSELDHGNSKLTLVDGTKASIETATALVSAEDKVKISVSGATLKTALDALCSALTSWVDTGGDTPNPATVIAINAAKALIDGVLK